MYAVVRQKIVICCAALVALVWSASVRAQVLPTIKLPSDASVPAEAAATLGAKEGQQRVVVLKDGGVLVGELRQEGDRYFLKRGSVEMQLRAESLLLVAASIEDAYQQRRTAMAQGSAPAHLELAAWCLRYNLLAQAAAELAAAEQLEPENGRRLLLERRLASMRDRAQNPVTVEPPPAATPEAEIAPLEAALVQVQTGLSELRPGVVEHFTRRVQPVLVNNCTATGCHQVGGKQDFQLDRAILHGLANRRSTTRNLTATLELVDRKDPMQSPLLTVPRERHGGMDRPVFGPRQEAALRHLVQWVHIVSGPSLPAERQTLGADGVQMASAEDAGKAALASPVTRADGTSVEDASQKETPLEVGDAEYEPLAPRPSQYGGQLERWTPRDEFDPEIFNRQNARSAGAKE
jgi:hypothetical protein